MWRRRTGDPAHLRRLIPGSETDEKNDFLSIFTRRFDHVAGVTQGAVPFESEIGRKFPPDLISKAQSRTDRG